MNVFGFTASEILQTAIQIEENASRYYLEASASGDSLAPYSELFLRLSQTEKEHAKTFSVLRENLSQSEKKVQIYDPGNEMLFYLQEMSGLHGWEGQAGPNIRLTGKESPEQVLAAAIAAEKDTVFFYVFVKDYVPESNGRAVVERILKEEMKHVAILSHELLKLQNKV